MSRTGISLLLLLRRRCFLSVSSPRFYSSSSSSSSSSPESPKPSNLSARLSFVFEQIDAMERERQRSLPQKDETLRRIRAWRESKNAQNTQLSNTQGLELGIDAKFDDNGGISTQSLKLEDKGGGEREEETVEIESSSGESKDVSVEFSGISAVHRMELVHPWPEWIELMERLVQQNYFDHRRKDEDKMIQELGFKMDDDDAGEESFDFTGDHKKIMTACLNFGKDRFDILRSLSRQDIQILVGYGCPSADKRLVFSAKVLRKHAHLDEGDVCSSCNLRSSCEKAFLLTNKEDEARTVDVMRVLATFGLDYTHGLVANKSLMKEKPIKTVIRKLFHEVVKLSAVPIDPNLPPPIIKRPPPKVKQPPPPPKKRVGRDDIEMKKGDWLCPKCDFMNFAKNTVCLQCDAKRPKRELLPGEWECPECNFLNYRRNTVCFHCECKRPPDQFMEDKLHEKQHDSRMKLERVNRQDVSNAWNFDFDDDESDGADVAAFEYGDSSVTSKNASFEGHDQGRIYGPEEKVRSDRFSRLDEREYSVSDNKISRMGFDDFDDEEDDVNSYELDTRNDDSVKKVRNFSDIEEKSELEDEDFDDKLDHRHPKPLSPRRPSRPMREKAAFGSSENENDDFDSDDEASVLPKWRSSHVANYRQGGGRGPKGQSRGLSYGSDEEIELDSDEDNDFDEDFGSRKGKSNKFSGKGDFRKRQRSGLRSDSDSDDMISSYGSRSGGKKSGRGKDLTGHDSRAQSNSRGRGGWRDPWDNDFERSPRESHGNNRGSRAGNFRDRRMGRQGGGSRNFGPKAEEFGNHQHGRFSKYGKERDCDSDDFRNKRRVIER